MEEIAHPFKLMVASFICCPMVRPLRQPQPAGRFKIPHDLHTQSGRSPSENISDIESTP